MIVNKSKAGAIAAIICSLCYIFGLYTLLYIAPDLYDLPKGRLRIINQYGGLLYLWYFIVFALVGLCLLFINAALLKQNNKPSSSLTIVTTLAAYVSACYLFIICAIEIISNEFFLAQHLGTTAERSQLIEQIYTILINLRSHTEWTLDVWLLLVNIFLYKNQRFNPAILLFGFCTGILGIMILNPVFQPLAYYYVAAIGFWFMAIGIMLFKPS